MSLIGEVIPRQDLTPYELKILGKSLRRWSIRMAGRDNLSVELDQVTVSDLLAGELPKPFILRYLQRLDEIRSAQGLALLTGTQKKRIYEELLRNVPENMRDQGRRDACSRSVFFRADYTGKCARVTHQRTALLRSIGRSLSSAYVEAIVIDR